MTEQTWTPNELDRIGAADKLRIAPRRADGTLRQPPPTSATGSGFRAIGVHVRGAATA
jgi:hypothetical protein